MAPRTCEQVSTFKQQ